MDDTIRKQSVAHYFKSATHLMEGHLVMTNDRLKYSGKQQRIKMNHGALGNKLRDKLEDKMGYNDVQDETIFDLPLSEVQHSLKRYGLSKRLVITDKDGKEYKLTINGKEERNSWLPALDEAKAAQG